MRKLPLFSLVALLSLVLAPSAGAFSSGTITNAYANAEWTRASMDVSVNPTVCVGSGYCSYHAVVMAQPNLPSYNCVTSEFGDSDPNTQVAWFGPTLTTNAPYSASVSEAIILNRVTGQRVCLELVGENEYVSALCERQRKIIEEFTHEPSAPCKPEKFFFQEYAFASALLTVAPVVAPVVTPPVTPVPLAPVATTPKPATAPKVLKCPKNKDKVTRHGKQMCVKRHKPKAKH